MTEKPETRKIRRLVWQHTASGIIPIMGEGMASNKRILSLEDEDWLNEQFPTLEFRVQEWDGDDWIEVRR